MNVNQCAHMLEGPRVGRRVVLWRRNCRNKPRPLSMYCWQHQREHETPRRRGGDNGEAK